MKESDTNCICKYYSRGKRTNQSYRREFRLGCQVHDKSGVLQK
jgi:hypothetical protein